MSRAGRSHSVVPTLSPGTTAPQAPPITPTHPDAPRPTRAHSAWRVTARSRDNRPERFPLCDVADAAGRLGLICRVDESPAGPLAVYRVAGRWRAIADRCPHAGAVLSAGEIDGAVVTCPGHGSRFDIRTGERLRGPADTDIEAFQLVQEGGQIYLPIRR